MNIYPSTQVRPYVYFGINPITGEFYIGYREINTEPSHIDLFKYRTSSKTVKPKFDQFEWYIVAEFKSGNDAYDFEQQLIFENWGDPLLCNESCFYQKARFKNTEEGKKKQIEAVQNRVLLGTHNFQNEEFIKEKANNIKEKAKNKEYHTQTAEWKESQSKWQQDQIALGIHHTQTAEWRETCRKISVERSGKGENIFQDPAFIAKNSENTKLMLKQRRDRQIVSDLRKLASQAKIKLGSGWIAKSDQWILSRISEITAGLKP